MAVSVETSKTILLVFSDPAKRYVFRLILESGPSLTILQAPDVKTAKAIISKKWPNLIIVEHWIGLERGVDFVRLLRSQPAFAKIPIMMQVVGDQEKVDEAKNAGVDVVMKMPVDRQELISMVQSLIQSRNL